MCNAIGKDGMRTGGQLEVLDLTDAILMRNFYDGRALEPGSVGICAFVNCITLREIKFGKYLYNVNGTDLSGCISLTKIEVSEDNETYTSIDGILYQFSYNPDWSTSERQTHPRGKWRLIKVPSNMQNPHAINFDLINLVESRAFEDTRLRELWLPAIPPACAFDAFKGVDEGKITLHVPAASFNSYWSHPAWGKFSIKPF